MVLQLALRERRTATSAEVWVMLGVEEVFGSSEETFSARSPMSCQDGTVKVRPPPASRLSRKSSRAATPLWMIAVFSIVSCWVYGVKRAGTITSEIWVDTLTMVLSSGDGVKRFSISPWRASAKIVEVASRHLGHPRKQRHVKFCRKTITPWNGKQLASFTAELFRKVSSDLDVARTIPRHRRCLLPTESSQCISGR